MHWLSGITANSAKPADSAISSAWSPGLNFVTPSPTAATTPTGSLPGMNGSGGLN